SKEETKRLKRKGLNLEKEQVKKQKSSVEAPEIETSTEEFTEEKMKEMKQLDNYSKVYKFQSQQRRPMTKKQKKEYYIVVIKSNLGGGSKISKEETERLKRKGLNLEKEQVKKQKSSEEAPEIETSTEEFT
nr:hypothetical protein [Tanacetum cinerariifolium]